MVGILQQIRWDPVKKSHNVQEGGGGQSRKQTNEESARIFKQQDECRTSCSDLIEEHSPRSATLQRAEF